MSIALEQREHFQKLLSKPGERSSIFEIVSELLDWKGLFAKRPASTIELNNLLEQGIPMASVSAFSKVMDIPMSDIAPMLNISYKTLTRKKKTDTFDPAISSLVYEIAATYAHALEIFRDVEKATKWFDRPNVALGKQKPKDLLRTMTGINLVNQVLGRLEEGVYS